MQHGTIGPLALATLLAALAAPAAAVDLSGDYVSTSSTSPLLCQVTSVQTGTAISVHGPCFLGPTRYELSLTGTVDPDTGAFSETGEIAGLCADLVLIGTGDGEETHSTYTSSTPICGSGSVFATKCSNGVIDPMENCEDGNFVDGDCCSARCRIDPVGTACASDAESCTDDVCEASGACIHVPATRSCDDGTVCTIDDACAGGACTRGTPALAGQVCESDFDPCTDDVCDGAGACTHVPLPPAACRRAVACHSTCTQELAACKLTCPGHGQARRDCRAACAEQTTCAAPGAPIRTLAYVVTECSQDPQGLYTGRQKLLVRRGNCDPVTIKAFDDGPPHADPQKLCALLGGARWGELSTAVGLFQRLTVLPDGSGIVYEVNHAFSLEPPNAPAEDGLFFVRSDGRGTRRIGDPSRRSLPDRRGGSLGFSHDGFPVHPDGHTIAMSDIGTDTEGGRSEQIFLIDLDKPPPENKRQLTHLRNDRCCELFVDNASGFNAFPGFYLTYHGPGGVWGVTEDGAKEEAVTPPIGTSNGTIVENPRVAPAPRQLLWVPFGPEVVEVFWIDGKRYGQVTNFDRPDTFAFGGFIFRDRGFFTASVNRRDQNPDEVCQVFSAQLPFGTPRQLTHLPQDGRPISHCDTPIGSSFALGETRELGCGMSKFEGDPITGAVLFSSSCDPVRGLNPFGEQIFAMRPDGTGLRQLTRTRGRTVDPDGTIHVELPGPFAYTSRDTR